MLITVLDTINALDDDNDDDDDDDVVPDEVTSNSPRSFGPCQSNLDRLPVCSVAERMSWTGWYLVVGISRSLQPSLLLKRHQNSPFQE